MEKLVSIVLPVYNGEKYLRESIDSILAQSYQNWELIIVDDFSTDDTQKISNEYTLLDARIKYYRNEKNLRLPRNLNRGFSLAKGEYLTWTSDDNRYKPQAIKRMVQILEADIDAQFVFASCRIIDESGDEIEYLTVTKDSPKFIVGSNSVGACFLYTRKVYNTIGDYDPNYILVEDFDYWQRICMRYKAIGIPEILYEYRWHAGALTSTMRKEIFNKNLEKMLLKNRNGFGKLSPIQSYYYYSGLSQCRDNLGDSNNPYKVKLKMYQIFYFFCIRVPSALKRKATMLQHGVKSRQGRIE